MWLVKHLKGARISINHYYKIKFLFLLNIFLECE